MGFHFPARSAAPLERFAVANEGRNALAAL
jgi:hypothetical protein